jgi:hypothetical protein
LDACQQQLPFGQGQAQIGDIGEIIGPVNLHDVCALPLALRPDLHQPQNPGHASTSVKEQTQKYPSRPRAPNLEPVPLSRKSGRCGIVEAENFRTGEAAHSAATRIMKGLLNRPRGGRFASK